MGFFDRFKKKPEERHYDPTDIKVGDLEKGYLLDYEFETWTVKKMAEYDWGDNFFTREYIIESRGKEKYLTIEEDEGLKISLFDKIKYRKLGEDVVDYQKEHDKFPDKIVYNNITYFLDEESAGFYRDVDTDHWEEVMAFDFVNDDEDRYLSIEQWDENDFEASIGVRIKPSDISNILPVS